MGLDDKIKYYLVMRNDVVELGFKNMDRFGADLFCLVMRELRRSIEKNNRSECRFYYWELKEYLSIDDHVSYEMYKKEIDRFRKTILSCWYEFENKEIGVEMVVFMEVINDKKNKMITVKANPDFLEFFLPSSKFTYLSLTEFCNLKTMYSKRLYAFLKQFRNTGYRRISVEQFREYMGAEAKTYDDFAQLRRRVLLPALNEITDKNYIKGLQFKEIKENGSKKVTSLVFKFWVE
ncbi:MAG: replication initiation protein [Erysipelotrichaceae bacterium]|nr:replication initiation protein [Erysipelotrichaceae bacterium]